MALRCSGLGEHGSGAGRDRCWMSLCESNPERQETLPLGSQHQSSAQICQFESSYINYRWKDSVSVLSLVCVESTCWFLWWMETFCICIAPRTLGSWSTGTQQQKEITLAGIVHCRRNTSAALTDIGGIRDLLFPPPWLWSVLRRGWHSCCTCLVAGERTPGSRAGDLDCWIPPHKEPICSSNAHPNRLCSLFPSLLNYMQMSKQNNTACPKLLMLISIYTHRW